MPIQEKMTQEELEEELRATEEEINNLQDKLILRNAQHEKLNNMIFNLKQEESLKSTVAKPL